MLTFLPKKCIIKKVGLTLLEPVSRTVVMSGGSISASMQARRVYRSLSFQSLHW